MFLRPIFCLVFFTMGFFLNASVNASEGKESSLSNEKNRTLRFVFISDTHGKHYEMENLPKGDFLIFCGDMCSRGVIQDVFAFTEFLKKQPHKYKIVIAGNHDFPFEERERLLAEQSRLSSDFPSEMQKAFLAGQDMAKKSLAEKAEKSILSSGAKYLNDSGVEIEGIKIWGSPIQPSFNDWAFNRDRGEDIKKHWDKIPSDTDVLITHGPPMGILDKTARGEAVGCRDLFNKVKKINPRVHAFGHIHEAYGMIKKSLARKRKQTVFINASNVNLNYNLVNPPIVIDLKLSDFKN